MKRVCISLIGPALVCAVAWLAGLNFDKRGVDIAFIATISILAFFLIYVRDDGDDL